MLCFGEGETAPRLGPTSALSAAAPSPPLLLCKLMTVLCWRVYALALQAGKWTPLPIAHFEQEVRMTLKSGAPGSQAWYVCPSVQSAQRPQAQGPAVWPQRLLPVPPPFTSCLQAERSGPQHLSKEPAGAHQLIRVIRGFVIGREERWRREDGEEGRVRRMRETSTC